MRKPRSLTINGQVPRSVSVSIFGDLVIVVGDWFTKLTPLRARRLAAHLVKCADYIDSVKGNR